MSLVGLTVDSTQPKKEPRKLNTGQQELPKVKCREKRKKNKNDFDGIFKKCGTISKDIAYI